jgi:DASH complex subunit ASK1
MAQQPPTDILLHPPFFVIPGISPTSPISQQTEQIDQLNTLLLQEIDANFAKFHQVITTKILPQIKRYAIAAEPVREGAKVRSVLPALFSNNR